MKEFLYRTVQKCRKKCREKAGMELVQVAILIAIAIALGIIFRTQITGFVNKIFSKSLTAS